MGETDGLGSAIQCAKVSLIQPKSSLPVSFYEVSVRPLGACELSSVGFSISPYSSVECLSIK
jgi:hypothetical protein